ncbi:esterase 1 [Cyathus striatus]|nr:esterase 1 [Cyathus striatus]
MLLSTVLLAPFVLFSNAIASVSIGRTVLTGTEFTSSRVEFFGGIPFAIPPVGKSRLKPAVLSTTLPQNRFDATQFGLSCPQKGLPVDSMSEDCLTLNVFRPANLAKNAKMPVMFWIYGGVCIHKWKDYNGTVLVQHSVERGTPIIYANANYRLGPLGFPQGAEAGTKGVLNLGLKDQLTALQWIKDNISAFGGDAEKVTVFGQSAGATSISIHLLGDTIEKLVRAAILESSVDAPAFGPEKNEASWQNFVSSVAGCSSVANTNNTIDCVRSATESDIITGILDMSSSSVSFPATIDGHGGLLPDIPSRLSVQTKFPLITGSNKDEWTVFTSQDTNTTQEIVNAINTMFPPFQSSQTVLNETTRRILELYPNVPALGAPFGTGNNTFGLNPEFKRFAAIFGDILIQAPRRQTSQTLSNEGVKVFSYHFSDPDATQLPVTHASEISYVYGGLINTTSTAQALSKTIQDYWISFVVSLDPNDGRELNVRPEWSEYTPKNEALMQLNGHDIRLIADDFRREKSNF